MYDETGDWKILDWLVHHASTSVKKPIIWHHHNLDCDTDDTEPELNWLTKEEIKSFLKTKIIQTTWHIVEPGENQTGVWCGWRGLLVSRCFIKAGWWISNFLLQKWTKINQQDTKWIFLFSLGFAWLLKSTNQPHYLMLDVGCDNLHSEAVTHAQGWNVNTRHRHQLFRIK